MARPTTILNDVLGEKLQPGRSGKSASIHIRSYLWQIIRCYTARGSMASWGLPFEAIAASMLLRDGPQKDKPSQRDD